MEGVYSSKNNDDTRTQRTWKLLRNTCSIYVTEKNHKTISRIDPIMVLEPEWNQPYHCVIHKSLAK